MGDLIGGILGGVGSIAGAIIQNNAANTAAQTSLTGYNYGTSGAGAGPENNYIAAGQAGLGGMASAQGTEAGLLGLDGPAGTSSVAGYGGSTGVPNTAAGTAFNNYLNSTGYNFQLQQGAQAINANAASKGLLNSGGNAKALTAYGQNLGGQYFNNYLSQLGNFNTQAGNAATMGQNSLTTLINAGTQAGSNAAGYQAAGGNAIATGINGALGNAANVASNFFTTPTPVAI